MKTFTDFLKESVIDIPRNSLDPNVFQFPDGSAPIMNPSIRNQIVENIKHFEDIAPVKDFFVTGSILTKTYTPNSDIDVTVELHPEYLNDDVSLERYLILLKKLNGKLAIGTQHPVNYFIVREPTTDDENYDAIYDVQNERWRKEPKQFEFNVTSYVNKFLNTVSQLDLVTAQLRRDIIDYDELSKFSKAEINNIKDVMQSKLYEINQSVNMLIDIRKTMKRSRKEAFERPMTPEELMKYQSKNRLPANVIYKLIQKYYYWNFIDRIRQALGESDTPVKVDPNDLDDIKKAEATLYPESEEIEKADLLFERRMKLRKINWNKPPQTRSGSHLQVTNRGTDRKTLRQVPQSMRVDKRSVMSSNIGSAKKIVEVAKDAPSGIWRISPLQVRWIAQKYHHIAPSAAKNIKHLGNTGIMVWRKAPNVYYLVKASRHLH